MAETIARRRERHRRRKPVWPYVLAALLAVILVTAIMVGSYFITTELNITMNGDAEITLEYGEAYQELGAAAFFGDKQVEITTQGQIQADKIGT